VALDPFDVSKAILKLLTTGATVTDLVSTRIRRRVEQSVAMPFIRYNEVSQVPETSWMRDVQPGHVWNCTYDFQAFSQSLSQSAVGNIMKASCALLEKVQNYNTALTALSITDQTAIMARPGPRHSDYDETDGTWVSTATFEFIIQEV